MQSRWLSRGALLALGLGVAGLSGCEEKSTTINMAGDDNAAACDLSFATLDKTEWVFLKANPDKSETPDHAIRLKFKKDAGKLQALYNVGSVADMYTYNCEENGKELICREAAKPKDYCQAFIAGGAKCDAATLKKFAPDLTDDEIAKGIKEGTELADKYRDKPEWKSFLMNNNNLGNKLRGIIYVKLDTKACRLVVQDNYLTIYNGKRVEDSNPAGVNPFVKNEMGELLWEHCTNHQDLIASKSGDYPSDPANVRTETIHPPGSDVHFWYLAGDVQKPAEGCTHTFDTWLNGKPLTKGLKPAEVGEGDKILQWHFSNKFEAPSASGAGEVVHTVINSTCAGKTEKKVACAAVLIK